MEDDRLEPSHSGDPIWSATPREGLMTSVEAVCDSSRASGQPGPRVGERPTMVWRNLMGYLRIPELIVFTTSNR